MRRTECGIFSVKMKARARVNERESAREGERASESARAWTALLLIHALA